MNALHSFCPLFLNMPTGTDMSNMMPLLTTGLIKSLLSDLV